MFLLPTFNARLNPCPVSPAEFTPHAQGNFCGQCQRVVHDFSQSTNPRADLAAARAAAPDGRVCGRFGAAQVQTAPKLSRRLRWFVSALVLVVAQGLTAREALAQVRGGGTGGPVPVAGQSAAQASTPVLTDSAAVADSTSHFMLGMVTETMPSFRGGGSREVVQYIQQQIVWPRSNGKIILKQGRVFASFTVGTTGRVHDAKIVKSLHPRFDAEVLRVVRLLPNFKPGEQFGKPVAVSFTVPITFKLK
ncbi:TonB family protein [Hymenobacter sp. DH14]|uniref:TonB family protein n=1 Tax=Hymenobacter cyanobacteriorum TaxID=2926463 RepID=A0A9X2AHC7_9BACT|nr:energy transducer TonB [Hymenobacter cyanobacteriorum]MCI1188678.1 TonB family protein [Hymenobacter cyanobacteriorum]